jgi:phosphoglycolate phosphatase-like HAD superfamily hydrolase
MKKYLIFDLDWTLIESQWSIFNLLEDFFKKNFPELKEKAMYIFKMWKWRPLFDQLEDIFEDKEKAEIYKKIIYNNLNEKIKWSFFFKIPEKIKELSKKYKLFLTTWNSTTFAKNTLKKWNILDCFELVYWSDKILKWEEHLELFKEYSWDENFYEKSFYIWDWNADREFAKQKNIDFIHIWNDNIDKYEIESVVNIDDILKK